MTISYDDNLEYAELRLNGTVVRERKSDTLVVVKGLRNEVFFDEDKEMYRRNIIAEVTTADGTQSFNTLLKGLELTSPTLGYINCDKDRNAYYVCRRPLREDWRQGLRQANLGVVHNGNMERYFLNDYKYLEQPVKNKYPSLEECFNLLKDEDYGWTSVAFSRSFCVDRKLKIVYKGRKTIGVFSDDKQATLLDEFSWLKEALDEKR